MSYRIVNPPRVCGFVLVMKITYLVSFRPGEIPPAKETTHIRQQCLHLHRRWKNIWNIFVDNLRKTLFHL